MFIWLAFSYRMNGRPDFGVVTGSFVVGSHDSTVTPLKVAVACEPETLLASSPSILRRVTAGASTSRVVPASWTSDAFSSNTPGALWATHVGSLINCVRLGRVIGPGPGNGMVRTSWPPATSEMELRFNRMPRTVEGKPHG